MNLTPLPSQDSFSKLWKELENAKCCWVMGSGRPVTVDSYSGSYQLGALSKRVMDIWHTKHMSGDDRACLAKLNTKITEWYQQTKEQIGRNLCIPDSFTYAKTLYSHGPNTPLVGDAWFVNKDNLVRGYTKEEWEASFPGMEMPKGEKISSFTTDPETKLDRVIIKAEDLPQETKEEDDWVKV